MFNQHDCLTNTPVHIICIYIYIYPFHIKIQRERERERQIVRYSAIKHSFSGKVQESPGDFPSRIPPEVATLDLRCLTRRSSTVLSSLTSTSLCTSEDVFVFFCVFFF